MTLENASTNGDGDRSEQSGEQHGKPDIEGYQHSLDWRDISDLTGYRGNLGIDISTEPLEVRAAFVYLSNLPNSLWGNWCVDSPDRRLLAARWLAEQHRAMDMIMKRQNV